MKILTPSQQKSNVSGREIREPLEDLEFNGGKFCQLLWGQKYPTEKKWQNNPHNISEINLRTHGVGILFGYGNLVGMDVDNQAGCDRFTRIFGCPPHEYESVSWASGKRFDKSYSPEITSTSNIQVLFRLSDSQAGDLSSFRDKNGESSGYMFKENELDVRWSGRQSVLPSLSPHPDTEKPYYWVNSPCEWDIAPIPEDAWDRLLQEIEEDQKNRGYKSNNVNPNGDKQLPIPLDRKSPTFTDPIPLINCLSREHRDMIASGVQEGGRNEAGAALARDLIGASNKLSKLNIPFSDCPESLFEEFCNHCTPPISPRERATIWRSAERDNPTPCLTDEMLENCVKSWHRQQNKVDDMRTPKEQREILERQFSRKGAKKKGSDWASELAELYRNQLAWDRVSKRWRRYLKGCWDEIYKEDINGIIRNYISAEGASCELRDITSIEGLLRSDLKREWDANQDLLPYEDGVFNLKTNEFSLHDHRNNLTWKLPYKWHSQSTNWKKINDWLDFVVQGKQVDKDILIAFAAATLRGRSDLQKFLMLQGISGSGKSTFIRLLMDLVGVNNFHESSLHKWNNSTFESANGRGKRLIAFSDEDGKIKNIENFKKLTGGELICYERKGKDAEAYKFNGMVVVASNHSPFVGGSLSAIARRKIEISFSQVVPSGARRDLNADFQDEIPAFARYLLSLDNDWVTKVLLGSKEDFGTLNAVTWENICRNNPLAAWVDEWVIFDSDACTQIGGAKASKDDNQFDCNTLYQSYTLYCNKNNGQATANRRFSGDLLELANTVLMKPLSKVVTRDGNKIKGIRLRTPNDDIPTFTEFLEGSSEKNLTTDETIVQENSKATETQTQQEEKKEHKPGAVQPISEKQPTIAAATPSPKSTNHSRPSRGFAKHNNLPDEREQLLLKVKNCVKANGLSDEELGSLISKVYGDSAPLEKLGSINLECLLEEMEHLVSDRSIK